MWLYVVMVILIDISDILLSRKIHSPKLPAYSTCTVDRKTRAQCWQTLKLAWWRHQMKTLSALLVLCAGNSPVTTEFPHKGQWRGALMFSLICALAKRLRKHSWRWWFETSSRSFWRRCNGLLCGGRGGHLIQVTDTVSISLHHSFISYVLLLLFCIYLYIWYIFLLHST